MKFKAKSVTGIEVTGDLIKDAINSTVYYNECPFRIAWVDGTAHNNIPVVTESIRCCEDIKPVIIETILADGNTEWGVSFEGYNPTKENYMEMEYEIAAKLFDSLTQEELS